MPAALSAKHLSTYVDNPASVLFAVQENHHCALTSHILRQQGSNLLQRFTGADWWQARRLLIDAILCTDMHHHFALTQELQKHSLLYLSEDEGDRTLLVSTCKSAGPSGAPYTSD